MLSFAALGGFAVKVIGLPITFGYSWGTGSWSIFIIICFNIAKLKHCHCLDPCL